MLVLGIDPGSRCTGYGLVATRGEILHRVESGRIVVPERAPLPERLLAIHAKLKAVIGAHSPDAAAVEDVFYAHYPQGALLLGHARGVALLAAAEAGLPVHSYPPAQVKRTLSGHGRAEKQQVARLVAMLLQLPEPPPADEADALAVAICHCASARGRRC